MSKVSSSIYWNLPGPSDFKHRVTEAARNARTLVLSFTQEMPVNPLPAVEAALGDANIYAPIILTIKDGMAISAEIGSHFNSTNMPAELLAIHVQGGAHAVVLFAKGAQAQIHCEKYAKEFIALATNEVGDVRLVVAIQSGECQTDIKDAAIRVIAFDGGLKTSEMQAYVSQRMISYEGPGSTSLYRHLVTEYSSFDPKMAEELADMDASQLMNLPNSLDGLMGENLLRWARSEWVAGVRSSVSKELHPLHEWYVARHPGPQSAVFEKLCRQRFWRACVKAIVPWLEERRATVIDELRHPLLLIADSSQMIKKKFGEREKLVHIDEIEYNDIVFLSFSNSALDPARLSARQKEAVRVCKTAKTVRDDIAHLRAPHPNYVMDLINAMDEFITY